MKRAGAVIHAGVVNHPFTVVDHCYRHRRVAALVAAGPEGGIGLIEEEMILTKVVGIAWIGSHPDQTLACRCIRRIRRGLRRVKRIGGFDPETNQLG